MKKNINRIIAEQKKMKDELVFQLPPLRKLAEFASITFPPVVPERDVADYLESKIHTKEQLGEPNQDSVNGPGVELQSRRRTLELADARLQKVRLISKGRKADLDKEWKIVKNLQEQLRGSTISFENFIKENMEKRERAEKKVHEEVLLQDARKENIEHLVYQMRRLYEAKKIFESNIRAFKIYENYLQMVVNISEYKDENKVIQRFGALQEAKETAFEESQNVLLNIEESMGQLKRMAEENGFVIIGMKNKYCELNTRFCAAQKNALLWESTVTAVKEECKKKYEDQNTVKQVCRGLYDLMNRRKGQVGRCRFVSDSENEFRMISISKTLLQMEKIIRIVKDGTGGKSDRKKKSHPHMDTVSQTSAN